MCGICGLISRRRVGVEVHREVTRANAMLHHRGPDGEGTYSRENVVLAMRRLSIIDVQHGWQPLFNEDRSLSLVANGEIYNAPELRAELQRRGHAFATGSDCEVVLHLYEEDGVGCLARLRGMFALALWDDRCRRLFLARDRMGEKPLYLAESSDRLLFASEMKALLATRAVPFELDPKSVYLYFHYQYVPDPATPLKGVRKLPAGHYLTAQVDSWRIEEKSYWCLEDAPPLQGDPAERIRAELEAASRLIVRSDVPVGIALSGGVDSCAVAALATRAYPGRLQAFTVGYSGQHENDERAVAREFAARLSIPHHTIEVKTDESAHFFPELVFWTDDPIADIAGYGYYAVMRLAREHGVPVMLQGQGGDELFWGYDWVRHAVVESLRKISHGDQCESIRELHGSKSSSLLAALLRQLSDLIVHCRRSRLRSPADQMVFMDLTLDFLTARQACSQYCHPSLLQETEQCSPADLFRFPFPWPQVDLRLTRLICDTYLRENGIAQGDRLSMASSVEPRFLFLDHRLVETVVGLRKTHTDYHLPPKTWLKDALRGVLPEDILKRPKRGFQPPVREWHKAIFREHGHLLADGYLVNKGILDRKGAVSLADGPFPMNTITPFSFKALVLELWCRRMDSVRKVN